MKKLTIAFCILFACNVVAQPLNYSVANAHSHNDYNNPVPFLAAYSEGFGSIEADILLQDGILYIGHSIDDIRNKRTLEDFYLKPLMMYLLKNKGHAFPDSSKILQLMIDVKTDAIATLDTLIALLKKYPELTNTSTLKWVISGNRPEPSRFLSYPSFIWFDGNIEIEYSSRALTRIAMMSGDLKSYTAWNGKSNLPGAELNALAGIVDRVHALNKPVRFWGSPDIINTWYQLIHLKVDFINTDHIHELASFLNKLPANSFISAETYPAYTPSYVTDGSSKKAKNIILLIGDGTGLAQLYAGYTANKGALNIFRMMNIGLSKTSSHDSYITDSAPGSTAISAGIKTNNRFVGVDHTGKAVPLIPVFAATKKKRTGIVTCGDIADATPADFYAHQKSRDDATAILKDLLKAPVDILMGSGDESLNNVSILKESYKAKIGEDIIRELGGKYKIVSAVDSVKEKANNKWIVIEKRAGLSMWQGRGSWLQRAFAKSTQVLSKNKEGFFLVVEGAQVDYGGHDNNMGYVATEVMDFDKTVGEALRFADKDGETLVIVTADHETGGLTLLDGDYTKGYVSGQFSTNDHTALPVQVFAYGPQSFRFRGVYENTELFKKIMSSFGITIK